MKFLWIFTTALSIFFAYHTYTHTRLRYKDLESVMMQNLAVEKGIKTTQRDTKKQYVNGNDLVEKQGNATKDKDLLQKATNINKYTSTVLQEVDSLIFIPKNLKIDNKLSLKVENIALLNEYNITFPQFIAKQDTSLQDMNEIIIFPLKDNEHYLPFLQQENLIFRYKIQ